MIVLVTAGILLAVLAVMLGMVVSRRRGTARLLFENTTPCATCGRLGNYKTCMQNECEHRSNEHQYPADKYQEMVNEDHAAENQSESDSYPE